MHISCKIQRKSESKSHAKNKGAANYYAFIIKKNYFPLGSSEVFSFLDCN